MTGYLSDEEVLYLLQCAETETGELVRIAQVAAIAREVLEWRAQYVEFEEIKAWMREQEGNR